MKYGVENPFSSEIIKDKIKEINMQRLGVEYPMQSDEIKSKAQYTCIERYGVYNPMKLDSVLNKMRETFLCKYGVEHPMHYEFFKEKHRNTMFRNYGVYHNMHNPDSLDKQQKSTYKRKEYKWQTGEISILQGYEPIVLKELETQGYKYTEILTSPSDMPEIWYNLNGNIHRYYPDFYIPEENLIIEVKSSWTLELHKDKNQAKFQAVKEAGFNFRLEIR